MMNPTVKAKWIAALRSGEYQQGQYALRTPDNKFCCLGVLCDVVDPTKWGHDYSYSYDGNWDDVLIPSGLSSELGIGFATQDILSKKNDDGYSFNEIAEWVEENL